MPGRHLLRTLLPAAALILAASGRAAEPPAAWRDDADLHAVRMVGKSVGNAVGDRGVVLRTADGGRTWEPRLVPTEAALHDASFLNDRVGWVAGGTTAPYTGLETGVLFRTGDGGATWERVGSSPLPRLHAVRFFDLRNGVAAGAATAGCPSGVLATTDGGATWKPFSTAAGTESPGGWRAAAWPAPGRGAVVGMRGRRAVVGDGQLIPARQGEPGLRGLAAVALDGLSGWAAGDGGLVLRTGDGGMVWQDPPAALPVEARDLFDFAAVAAVGENVWAAGRPGSVVWHSPDAGRTWRPQPTGTPVPIHALSFATPTDGVAVGALGLILRTTDGGTTWQPARSADRRAAVLFVSARPEGVSFPLVAALAGDQGYRTVALLPARPDLLPGGAERPNVDLKLGDAVAAAGGNAAVVDWPLPVAAPDLAGDRDALVADWTRRTEGRFAEVVLGRLVAAVRTWRPDVVVIDAATPGDAVAGLVQEAATHAVAQAADPTRFLAHRQHAGLTPWTTAKVYVRSTGHEPGDATIDPTAPLPRLDATVADLADPAAARLGLPPAGDGAPERYRLLPAADGVPRPGPFFGGVATAPGSASRRVVGEIGESRRAEELARRDRTLRAVAARTFDDPRQAAQVLAQIDELAAGLTREQAARQLYRLGEAHRARADWDLAEETFVELVERYPAEPPALDAAVWLLRLWGGAEPVWRRMRGQGARREQPVFDPSGLASRIDHALALADEGTAASTPDRLAAEGLTAPPPEVAAARDRLIAGRGFRTWDEQAVEATRREAVRIAELIRRTDPALFASPEVQFPLAALLRGTTGQAAALRRLVGEDDVAGGSSAAAAELALLRPDGSGPTAAVCGRAAAPPHLDAVFSDPCWQAAKPLKLVSEPGVPEGGLVWLAFDAKFLYVAATLPRVPGLPVPTVELAGRTHDAPLAGDDRLVLTLDLDRDYATAYRLAVDHRGRTSDDCWEDATWNPQWYVAADGDADRWRVEAAIPLDELTPIPPASGETWAVSVGRVVPTVGLQGWPRPADGSPRPESFGLLRFE